jgi:hypothetical protein
MTAAELVGGVVFFPPGTYGVSAGLSLTNASPISLIGSGMGSGSGGTQDGGTRIIATHSTGDVIALSGICGFTVRDLQICGLSAGARSSGVGLKISGVGTTHNYSSRVENVCFEHMYDAMQHHLTAGGVVEKCIFYTWGHDALKVTTVDGYESGIPTVEDCIFFGDTDDTTTQRCGAYLAPAMYTTFINCGWVGSQYHVLVDTLAGPGSTHAFLNCTFEEAALASVRYERNGYDFQKSQFIGCRFSNIGGDVSASIRSHFEVSEHTSAWLFDLEILDCTVFSYVTSATPLFNFKSCKDLIFQRNLINNHSAGANVYAAFVGSTNEGTNIVGPNSVRGCHAAKYGLENTVIFEDVEGLAFSSLPANVKNGSRCWVTDGTPFGRTLAGSSLGVWAQKVAGAWVPCGPPILPPGHLTGYTLSNNVSDANNDIDIATGKARAIDDSDDIILASALTKRLDASWAVGTNQGGLDTGSKANSTTYHLWAIKRPDTGVVDVLFSASATSPTMPTNYTRKRRLGSVFTNGSGNILAFIQIGDHFDLLATIQNQNGANPGTSAVTQGLAVPSGIIVDAKIRWSINNNGTAPTMAMISPLDRNAETPAFTSAQLKSTGNAMNAAGGNNNAGGEMLVRTNTSGQIRTQLFASNSDITLLISTFGWIDRRNRDD